MTKTKLICKNCGKEYDACPTCEAKRGNLFMWRQVACSHECYRQYITKVVDSRDGRNISTISTSVKKERGGELYKLRGFLNETQKVHDIADYKINEDNELEFTQTNINKVYRFGDYEYLIIPLTELKNIFGQIEKNSVDKNILVSNEITAQNNVSVKTEKPKRGNTKKNKDEAKKMVEMAVVEGEDYSYNSDI